MTGATVAPPAAERTTTLSLRNAATFFALAVLIHNGDHLRRGGDSVETDVFWLGSAAILVEIGVVLLVFARHHLAPLAAAIVGFQLALGYVAVHFTPERSWFSDSFVGTDASPVSIAAAALEAIAAFVLGLAGVLALRGRSEPTWHEPAFGAALLHPVVMVLMIGNVIVFVGSLATT